VREHTYFTYILAAAPRGPTYTGVTNDLRRRVEEHRSGRGSKHTAKYSIWRLVYFEIHDDIEMAILREKRIKRWLVPWKHELIEKLNPNWEDLSLENMDF